jgi:hypothetical protein
MQPLPVGETGGSEGKGKVRGGGSPGLHKPRTLDPGCGRLGIPRPLGKAFTLARVRGGAPLFCERGRYRMAETGYGLGEPRLAGRIAPGPLQGGFAQNPAKHLFSYSVIAFVL